mmetsp:Transcript_13634/g.44459  ORF Transcript_13634/g.44459 Transcript_13634/m.44459 type:complete len:644 (+) Transcript_13634:106-2037(+)
MAQTTALLGGGTDEGSSSFCGAEDEEKKDFLLSGASSEKAAKGALDPLKRARWPSTAFGLLAVMFGATQLPYSLGQMGWTYGLLAVGLSGVSTWASGLLIGRAAIATGAKSYPELGKKAFGPTGRRIIVAAQWMSYFLTGMTQIAFSGATYQQTFKGTKLQNVCTQGWMLVTTCLLAPCLMVPSFNDAVGLTVFVVSVQCFGLAIMYSQIAEEGRYSSAGLCYDKITRDSILATVANTAFAFGGHGVIPELIREMKQPKDFSKAFNVAYGFTVPMYVLSGAVGFWAWGNASSANFVENLKSTPWVKAYNWINTVGTFPLVVVNQVALFLNVELSFGILPTDVWVNSNRPKRMKPTTKRLGNNHPPELGGPHHGPHHGPPPRCERRRRRRGRKRQLPHGGRRRPLRRRDPRRVALAVPAGRRPRRLPRRLHLHHVRRGVRVGRYRPRQSDRPHRGPRHLRADLLDALCDPRQGLLEPVHRPRPRLERPQHRLRPLRLRGRHLLRRERPLLRLLYLLPRILLQGGRLLLGKRPLGTTRRPRTTPQTPQRLLALRRLRHHRRRLLPPGQNMRPISRTGWVHRSIGGLGGSSLVARLSSFVHTVSCDTSDDTVIFTTLLINSIPPRQSHASCIIRNSRLGRRKEGRL